MSFQPSSYSEAYGDLQLGDDYGDPGDALRKDIARHVAARKRFKKGTKPWTRHTNAIGRLRRQLANVLARVKKAAARKAARRAPVKPAAHKRPSDPKRAPGGGAGMEEDAPNGEGTDLSVDASASLDVDLGDDVPFYKQPILYVVLAGLGAVGLWQRHRILSAMRRAA